MARRILLSLITLAAAGAAWWLRVQQLSTAYDAMNGLPLPLDQWGWALWGVLGALALLALLLALPEKAGKALSDYAAVPLGAVLQGAGALLIAAGAAWQLYTLYPALRSLAAVTAAVVLLGALGLFGGLKACLGGETRAGALLLLPMCAAALQLVTVYREVSSDPILRHYEMRMLALGAAALAVISLAGLAFGAGGKRSFLFFAALTPACSAAALPTCETYPQALGLMGCALAALGFFFSVLFGIPAKRHPVYELVEDPFHTGTVRIKEELADAAVSPPEPPLVENSPAAAPVSPAPKEEPPVSKKEIATQVSAAPVPGNSAKPAPEPTVRSTAAEDDFDLSRVDRLLAELASEKQSQE